VGTSLGFNNLAVYDLKGERRIGVGAWVDSPPSLNIYDTGGKVVWTASAK
jgi:hypothetical protein